MDSGAGNRDGKSGQHGGSARYVLALCAVRLRAAENHVFNFFDVPLWSFAQHVLDTVRGEVFGTRQVKRSAKGFGKGRPRTGNYYCFSHVFSGRRTKLQTYEGSSAILFGCSLANGRLVCYALFLAELGEGLALLREPL